MGLFGRGAVGAPFGVPFGVLVQASVLLCGCDFPVSDSKYEVDDSALFNRVVTAFSSGSEGCAECLRASCSPSIDTCADSAACTELTECVQEEANPSGQARCASQVPDETLDDIAAHGAVRECWVASCKAACNVGKSWDCLGRYEETQPPESTVTLRQTLQYLCDATAVRDAEVDFCTVDRCGDRASTDAEGSYTIDLPVSVTGAFAGWSGFRRVTGGNLVLPHRLERNLPIWSDLVETTSLMSPECAATYLTGLASEVTADWESVMAVQLFDCQSNGADGVELTIPTAPEAIIRYVAKNGASISQVDTSSKVTGAGLALVANVPVGEHVLLAREVTSGKPVAEAKLSKVSDADLIIYSIFPDPVNE